VCFRFCIPCWYFSHPQLTVSLLHFCPIWIFFFL
jgi:hypothetical protein